MMIGNIVHKQLQSKGSITAGWLLEMLKTAEPDWFFNRYLFDAITARLNKLGCEKDKELESFNKYLKNDSQLTSLLELASTIPAKQIGNIVYKQLQSKGSITPNWFLTAVKAAKHDWHYDQELAIKITARLHELNHEKSRNLEQFNLSLNNDAQLISLLEQSSLISTKKVEDTVSKAATLKVEDTVIEAATLGRIVYQELKDKGIINTAWLFTAVKAAELAWHYDEGLSIKITARLNEFSGQTNKDLAHFNQDLNNDAQLTSLLTLAPPIAVKNVGPIQQLPEEPPPPVGREIELVKLMGFITLNNNNERDILLQGMGGVGKTMICRCLAYQCAETTNIKSILWINGHSGLTHYLRNVTAPAYKVDIADPDWLKRLLRQLKRAATSSVMFINNLGNSEEDLDVFAQLKQLNWHIVATSVYQHKQFSKTVTISELNMKQCVELFKSHYGQVKPEATDILEKLIQLAGHHTLTVELLAKISKAGNLAISRLYRQVKEVGFNLSNLTTTSTNEIYNETKSYKETQWELNQQLSRLFNLVELERKYKLVLRVMAIFPHQAYESSTQWIPWLALKSDAIMHRLASKGWLQNENNRFFVHPAIGHVAKEDIQLNIQYLKQVAKRFNQSIQPKPDEYWIAKATFVPHLLAISKYLEEGSVEKSALSFSLACIYQAQSDYFKAKALFLEVLEISEKVYGKNSHKLLDNLNHLSRLYRSLNQLSQAKKYSERSLEISKSSLGEDHVTTAVAMENLGSLYRLRGEYSKAFELYKKVAEINEAKLEFSHPLVTISLSRVADLLKSMGKYDEALSFYKKSLDITERTLKPGHINIAAALRDLGLLYQLLGRFNDAKPLHDRALKIDQKIFGEESYEASEGLFVMGALSASLKRPNEGLSYFKDSLKVKETLFGQNHTKSVPALESIANLHQKEHRLHDAVEYYIRALKINERFYSPKHFSVTSVLIELGRIYVRRDDKHWTEKEFWQHCNEKERLYGDGDKITFVPDHPCVGSAYYLEGQKHDNSLKKALELHIKGFELRNRVLPQTDVAIRESLAAIVEIYRKESKLFEALPYYKKMVDCLTAEFGAQAIEIGVYLAKIAPVFQQHGQLDTALDWLNQAIEIMEGELGAKDPLTKQTIIQRIHLRDAIRR